MKKNELERINKEFITNDYERRFNIKLVEIIRAIVGEELTLSELQKLSKIKKDYFKDVEKCKTFDFLSDISKKTSKSCIKY